MIPAIFGLSGPTPTSDERTLFRDADPAGHILFGRIGMTGHLLCPVWNRENPSTLSRFVIGEIIRKRIGFGGLLPTGRS